MTEEQRNTANLDGKLRRAWARRQRAERLRVVIVGAGFGGLAVVRGLSDKQFDITIVDKQNHHLFQPLLYQVATAGLSPADIAAPIRSIVRKHRNVQVILDEVTGVDPSDRRVTLHSGASLFYDVLVLATGARHSYFGADGWSQYAPGIKTIDDATRVRRSILLAMERAETRRQQHSAERGACLTFAVVGGGPTGVEMAGAIAELTRHAAAMDFRYVSPASVRIALIEAGPRLLPSFPERLAARAAAALESLGVELLVNHRVSDIDSTGVTLGDERIEAATVVWAAGVQASPAGAWIGAPTDRAGRVQVAPDLTAPGHADIFVIGDTAAAQDGNGNLVPGIAPAAKQQGEFVAKCIRAQGRGQHGPAVFRYRNYGMLATIGRKRAVADFGRIRLWGYPAWLVWTTAHLFFLVGFRSRVLVGLNWLWNYMTYERSARLITGLEVQKQVDRKDA